MNPLTTLFLLELGGKVKAFLDAGISNYNQGCTTRQPVSPATCGDAGDRALKEWSPKVNGQEILTPALRTALKGALGHFSYNLAAAAAGHPLR